MLNSQKTVGLQDRVVQVEGSIVSEMDQEIVMFNINKGRYYNLGTTGGKIWSFIKEPIAVDHLVQRLMIEYQVDRQECEAHVLEFLQQLLGEELIQIVQ